MWVAVRFDAVEPLQMQLLQLQVLRERVEDTIHRPEGNETKPKQHAASTTFRFGR